jgi:hypothetical protein
MEVSMMMMTIAIPRALMLAGLAMSSLLALTSAWRIYYKMVVGNDPNSIAL